MFANMEAERARAGMSQKDAAEILGVSARTYGRWVRGESEIPANKLIQMSRMWGKTADYLLGMAAEGQHQPQIREEKTICFIPTNCAGSSRRNR